MKRITLFLGAIFILQATVFAYDFYSTSPSGHVLYYRIVNDTDVYVTWQNSTFPSYYNLSGAVTIPSFVTHGGNSYVVTGVDNSAFSSCFSITSVTIPNSVITIGIESFDSCSSLHTINWGDSVQTIENRAFSYCSGLSSINLPNSVVSIEDKAFQQCSAANSIIIGNSVISIGESAFWGCSSVTSLIIGSSVETIGSGAFSDCSGITSVNIPSSVSYIGASAFYDCTNLTHVSYNGSVSEWLNITFNGIYSNPVQYSRSLYINEAVVKSVIVPEGIAMINNSVLCGMDSLYSVQLPSSLMAIDHYAFYGCSNLPKIELPSSVHSIGYRALKGCSNLDTIICKRADPPTCISDSPNHSIESFDGVPLTAKVLVPCQSVEEYQSSNGWDYFSFFLPQLDPVVYSVSSSNPILGYVDYMIVDECGHSIIANATPYEGCHFLYWSDGGTSNPYHYHSESNEIVLTAYFNTTNGIIVTLNPNDITMGGVTGSGVYHNGDTVVCTAMPFSGYEFLGWSNGSQDNPYTFIAHENTSLTAYFKAIGEMVVTLTPNDITMGGVTGGGVYSDGDTVVCTAIPFSGFKFRGWSNGSQENPYIFVVYENTDLMAVFVKEIGVEENVIGQIEIYPNPANTYVTINIIDCEEPYLLFITDKLGQTIKSIPFKSSDEKLLVDLSSLKPGVYFIRIGKSIQKLLVN